MLNNRHKLELTWIRKVETPESEPRVLIEGREKSNDDNQRALKGLEQGFRGKWIGDIDVIGLKMLESKPSASER